MILWMTAKRYTADPHINASFALGGTVAEQSAAAPAIPTDVVAFIESPRTTASELRRRYNGDHALIAKGLMAWCWDFFTEDWSNGPGKMQGCVMLDKTVL